jgi:hypothetical protein
MADILSPTGIEKPLGAELHSRAMYNRNLDRTNQVAIDAAKKADGLKIRHVMDTSDSSAVTTEASLGNTIASFTFKAGRKYRIAFEGNFYTSNIDTVLLLKLGTCAVTDADNLTTGVTVLKQTDFQAQSATRGYPCDITYSKFEPVSDTTLKIKMLASRVAGTGNIFFQRGAATPAILYIEDLGAQF